MPISKRLNKLKCIDTVEYSATMKKNKLWHMVQWRKA